MSAINDAKDKLTKLWTTGVFADLPADFLERLQAAGRIVDYGPCETLFSEHDPASNVYVIASGEISLAVCMPKQECRQIAVVGKGELLGWSSLTGRSRRFDTARTLTPVTAWIIDGDQLVALCRQLPTAGFELMHRVAGVLSERLTATRMQLVELSGTSLPTVVLESD